jgi:hypothetical protein
MVAPTARMTTTFGWAVSLLVLSAVQPAAWACPILIDQSAATPVSEFLISRIEAGDVWDHDEQAQLATAGEVLNLFGIGAAREAIADNTSGPGGIALQYPVLRAGLGLNNATGAGQVSLQYGANDNDSVSEHNIALSLYFVIDDINENVAGDLLTSYHAISRITGDITAAINTTIGLSSDNSFPQVGEANDELSSHNSRYDTTRNGINFGIWIRFLSSIDSLPYYIVIVMLYIIVKMLRMLWRRI